MSHGSLSAEPPSSFAFAAVASTSAVARYGSQLPRSLVYERVWGYDFGGASNSLDVHLSQLRRKLEEGGESRLIHTVRGLGYILREP
jgi:DNA-binding response OmpR family regulator